MSDITIFENPAKKDVLSAIENLVKGRTPPSEVRKRPVRGGNEVNYVNTYYMTRQIALITGFRWSSECLEERFYPDKDNPKEIGAKMRVIIWDKSGNQYHHEAWGSAEVKRYAKDDYKGAYKKNDIICIFDDLKGAYSDGIKKCLSYFGIANDIYGGRDLDYFGNEPGEAENGNSVVSLELSQDQWKTNFYKFMQDKHLQPSKVCEQLGISNIKEITDYQDALRKLMNK